MDDYDFSIPSKILSEFSHQRGIMFIDLTQEFKKFPEDTLYLAVDHHLTPKGHKIVANYIYDKLINDPILIS